MSYILAIDLGTSALKGLLLNKQNQVVAQCSQAYPLRQEQKGYSEQDPKDWVEACLTVMETLRKTVSDFTQELEGIAISGQMHSLILLDEQKEVLRPAILWNDTRTTRQCQKLTDDFGETLMRLTKNKALEGLTLPKILWVQEYEPDIWAKTKHILLPKDYLGYYLTGVLFTDKSDASGTLMYDLSQGTWAESILSQYHIPIALLPPILESTDIVGHLTNHIQNQFTFKKSVQVIAGGADNACSAVGAGILSENTGLVSIGTSGVFLAYERKAHGDYGGQLHLFHHGIPNGYYAMGVTLAAGHSLEWFKSVFAPLHTFEELLSEISTIPIGSNGLFFTPYIVGERTPYADSNIRGSFIGIDTTHRLPHFTRSVLEGITFSLKDSQQLLTTGEKQPLTRIISIGGGAKNREWLQMQADIFETDIYTLNEEQGAGLGAGIMAAVALGWYDSIEEAVKKFVTYCHSATPIPSHVRRYRQLYQTYRKIYRATEEICHPQQEKSME